MAARTVIKLNNIPHGFYEEQMKDYFAQFGKVKHVILIRSKKTHKSRGFGFVEFELPQVARAAAEAMHNYLFFNNVLKCRQMDKSKLPKNLFKKSYKGLTSVELHKKRSNSDERDVKTLHAHYKKIKKVQHDLKELGIDFKCHMINGPKE